MGGVREREKRDARPYVSARETERETGGSDVRMQCIRTLHGMQRVRPCWPTPGLVVFWASARERETHVPHA